MSTCLLDPEGRPLKAIQLWSLERKHKKNKEERIRIMKNKKNHIMLRYMESYSTMTSKKSKERIKRIKKMKNQK